MRASCPLAKLTEMVICGPVEPGLWFIGMRSRLVEGSDDLNSNGVRCGHRRNRVKLNRDVQQLHAEIEPSFFKSDTDDKEIAAFFAEKLATSGWLAATTVRMATCGLRFRSVQTRH